MHKPDQQLTKFFAFTKKDPNQLKKTNRIETAADRMQAAYIERPWNDA
jgi:hypothetical protein